MIISMPALGASAKADVLAPALALRQQAAAFGDAGQHDKAVEAWRAVLYAAPDDADAAHQLGLALAKLERHGEAVASFERALHDAPTMRPAKLGLGNALLGAGRHADARATFEDMLLRVPDDVEALTGQAASLRKLGRADEALLVAERAIAHGAGDAGAMLEQARALNDLKRQDEAIAVLEALCAQHEKDLDAAQLLGRLYVETKRHARAVELLRKVVGGRPADAFAWQELAAALHGAAAHGEAIEAFRRSLAIKPSMAAAHANMAMSLADLGRLDEAVRSVDRALSIEPDSRTVRFLKGCLHLMRGEFDQGWEAYEHRFSKDGKKGLREDVHAAPWYGEPIAGRSILVLGEQNHGDYIQFTSYVKALADMGAKVSFFVPPRLKRLFSSLRADVDVIDALNPDMRFDHQCHLLSLPHRFRVMGHMAIPTAPWLSAEPELLAKWRGVIGTRGLRVGVAWRGSNNDLRSFDPVHLAPLAAIPGVRLISLHTANAIPPAEMPSADTIQALGADYDTGEDGFIDATAVVSAVDLVISCDTSFAHLAGAVGKAAWITLNHAPEWRWQRGTSTSIWYPEARLYRQAAFRDWDRVFRQIAVDLTALANTRT